MDELDDKPESLDRLWDPKLETLGEFLDQMWDDGAMDLEELDGFFAALHCCPELVLQSQMPVVEKAIETAALMLGSDRSRGYCLEMICADFLAGANLDHGSPETLLFSMTRFFRFLPENQKQAFLENLTERAS